MKIKLIFMAMIIGMLLSSCKKEDAPQPASGGPLMKFVISQDSAYHNGGSFSIRTYEYNSNKKLIKVQYKSGPSTTDYGYDTITYNSQGKISKVEKFEIGNPIQVSTSTYNYTAGVLTSVLETGIEYGSPYLRMRNFTYSGGKLTTISVVENSYTDVLSVVFTGNNLSSVEMVGYGSYSLTTETTAPNPYYGLNYDSGDFINMFNKNNFLTIYETTNPSNVVVANSYTYLNGRVATIFDGSSITTLTYKEL